MSKYIFTYNVVEYLNPPTFGPTEAIETVIMSLIRDGGIPIDSIEYSLERTFIITTNQSFEDLLRLIRQVTMAELRPHIGHFYFHISPIPNNNQNQEMYNPENRNGHLQEYYLGIANRIMNR